MYLARTRCSACGTPHRPRRAQRRARPRRSQPQLHSLIGHPSASPAPGRLCWIADGPQRPHGPAELALGLQRRIKVLLCRPLAWHPIGHGRRSDSAEWDRCCTRRRGVSTCFDAARRRRYFCSMALALRRSIACRAPSGSAAYMSATCFGWLIICSTIKLIRRKSPSAVARSSRRSISPG